MEWEGKPCFPSLILRTTVDTVWWVLLTLLRPLADPESSDNDSVRVAAQPTGVVQVGPRR